MLNAEPKLNVSSCILDSSAVLALMNGEPGADKVAAMINGAYVSSVNFAEIISRLNDWGKSAPEGISDVEALGVEVVPLDYDLAAVVGELRPLTRSLGLSLGDRACLALGRKLGLPILTADRVWAGLSGFDIVLIR